LSNHKNNRIILTEIVEIETGKESRFYLVAKNNELKAGHGMCSGPYRFNKGMTYKIRFSSNYSNEFDNYTNWMECINPWSTE